ncbi:MAG: hypothetical protein IJI58_03440 [Bacilli bacterium]|nr:hypothetical protein [Bacilli bacterium]
MENKENNVEEPKTISPEEIGQTVGEEVPDVEPVQAEEKIEEKKDKKDNKKGVIIVLILIVLLATLGCLYFFVLNPNQKKTTKTETPVKEVYSEYRMTGNDLQAFDLYFLQLENVEKNKVYSPLSIKYALEMLSEGAKGETKKQIDDIIGEYQANKYPNNNHMSFANAMFIRDKFKDSVKEEYITKLKQKYNAEVILDPFASPKNINDWVSNKTFKLINNLVEDVSQNDFFLINALAINMNWKNRIQASSAQLPEGMSQMDYGVNYIHEKYSDYVMYIEDERYPAMKFNGIDNIKSVEVAASFNHYDIVKDKGEDSIRKTVGDDYKKYLQEHPEEVGPCPSVDEYLDQYMEDIATNYKKSDISTDFYISDTENEKVFAKDLQTYEEKTLQYVGIMPKKESLTDYIKNTDAKKLSKIISEMKEVKYENFKEGVITNIKGNIPLFKYDYELKLLDDLQELGIENIFDINKSDLSNMLNGDKRFIDKAIHKANIEFSNDGIKAAAATVMGGAGAAHACNYDYEFDVPVEKIDVTFDKPYMYVIRDKDSGEVWFVGTVYEPLKNK